MKSWRCETGFLYRTLSDGGLFIVEESTGGFFTLNGMAARVLGLVRDGLDFEHIVARLSIRFSVDPKTLRDDLRVLFEQLTELRLLKEATNNEGEEDVLSA